MDRAARSRQAVDISALPGRNRGALSLPEARESLGSECAAESADPEKTKVGEYLVADSIEAVVSLAQMGIVEIHTWNSTATDVDRPNRLVWDLDPGPLVSWKQVVKAAALVRDVLKTLNLRSWVKTTGGRGVHVVVPLKRKRTVTECLDFSRAVSEAIAKTDPRTYTTAFPKAGRERQILIDYLRNNRTNTTTGQTLRPFRQLHSLRSRECRSDDGTASDAAPPPSGEWGQTRRKSCRGDQHVHSCRESLDAPRPWQ